MTLHVVSIVDHTWLLPLETKTHGVPVVSINRMLAADTWSPVICKVGLPRNGFALAGLIIFGVWGILGTVQPFELLITAHHIAPEYFLWYGWLGDHGHTFSLSLSQSS